MPADVATSLKDWSTTASSNSPSGSTAISNNLDDNLRQIQTVVRYLAASDTIASATTTDLGSKEATFLTVSGTTTITGLGTVSAGIYKWVVFSGALTLTHNGTSLILPTGANLTTAAGDTALFLSLGSGNWRCLSYSKANGQTVAATSTFPDGAVGAPSITFTSDLDTGFYRIGTNQFGAAANGANVATFGVSSVTIPTLSSTNISATTVTASTVTNTSSDLTLTGGKIVASGLSEVQIGTSGSASVNLTASSNRYIWGVLQAQSSQAYLAFREPGASTDYMRFGYRANSQTGISIDTGVSVFDNSLYLLGASVGLVVESDSTKASAANVIIVKSDRTTTLDTVWRVTTAGTTFADGSYSSSGADYSEAFLYTGTQPQPGDTVTLDGDKVRLATQGDEVIGVISEKPAFIGDQKLVDQGGVVVGLVGKLKVNPGCPVDSRWRLLDATNNIYLVR